MEKTALACIGGPLASWVEHVEHGHLLYIGAGGSKGEVGGKFGQRTEIDSRGFAMDMPVGLPAFEEGCLDGSLTEGTARSLPEDLDEVESLHSDGAPNGPEDDSGPLTKKARFNLSERLEHVSKPSDLTHLSSAVLDAGAAFGRTVLDYKMPWEIPGMNLVFGSSSVVPAVLSFVPKPVPSKDSQDGQGYRQDRTADATCGPGQRRWSRLLGVGFSQGCSCAEDEIGFRF